MRAKPNRFGRYYAITALFSIRILLSCIKIIVIAKRKILLLQAITLLQEKLLGFSILLQEPQLANAVFNHWRIFFSIQNFSMPSRRGRCER